jgi:hypothetical protein
VKILLLFLLLPLTVVASDLPEAPLPQRVPSRALTALRVANLAAAAFDGYTTSRCMSNDPRFVEYNPFMGRHPSNARIALVEVGVSAVELFSSWELDRHGHHRAALAIHSSSIAGHALAGGHNTTESCF